MAGKNIKKEKEKIMQLLARGKQKGVLSYEEIMDSLSNTELSPEQIDAVSYTHLDVYKRQWQRRGC